MDSADIEDALVLFKQDDEHLINIEATRE
jgi:hypothetical protein